MDDKNPHQQMLWYQKEKSESHLSGWVRGTSSISKAGRRSGITCIANYKDGTKKGEKINVGDAALTYEEIGMNVDGMTLQIEGKETVQLQPTDKVAVFTFKLQPWQIFLG